MNTAPQAEIAAEPASAQETTTPATPSPAPEAAAPAETTAPPYFDANALDSILFSEAAPSNEAPKQEAPVTTPATTEAAPAATETPAPSTPAAEAPAGSTPQAAEAPAATESPASATPTETAPSAEPEKGLPNRISTKQFRTKDEQDALLIKHEYEQSGDPIDLREAFRILDSRKEQAKAAASAAAEEVASTPDPVATLETEVSEIRTKLKEAGENGSLMTGEIAELQIALADKTSDLKIAKLQQEQQKKTAQAEAAAAAEDRFAPSKADAYKAYPDAQVEDSPLNLLAAAVLSAWQSPNHPNHALLSQEDAPMLVVKAAADKLGIAPVGATPKPAAPAAPVTVAPTAPAQPKPAAGNVTTAPGSSSIGTPAAAPTATDLLKQSLTDPSILDKALGYDGTTLIFG